MNKNILFGGIGIFMVLLLSFLLVKSTPPRELKAEKYKGTESVVYMSATCGCCRNYASYLKREGFNVKTEIVTDLNAVKERFNIPKNLESCHTSIISGYVVEGHIPVEAIVKLLDGKESIRGIAMADMPAASPGMPGVKSEPFKIYKLTEDNNNELFISL